MNGTSQQIVGNRYRLFGELGRGGMGVVYRAIDLLNQSEIALKRVHTVDFEGDSQESTTGVQVALAREFQTLASLRHPHIIEVLDYGFDDFGQPYFAMNLMESPRPFTKITLELSEDEKYRLLVELLQALAYLHRRKVIHRDLKPDNALIAANGEVKVLDFGLARLRERQRHTVSELSGTPAYMAPETLQGLTATEETDLYAVGIMAYELFAGRHPFNARNIASLINETLHQIPDVVGLKINPSIAAVIDRLLEKDPTNRYGDAYEVIADLSDAYGRAVPQETKAIRESFLQAAEFVGRDQELTRLNEGLSTALEGRGSGWLVGGESGVGKSRLVEELRIRALVQGALVLRGRGVAGGGLPYQLWRDPLRRLVLTTEISPMDASVLKEIVNDIEVLLGQAVPDAPELDGEAGRTRLLTTIVDVFRDHDKPMVLILEDLHWAVESLDALRSLLEAVKELPLLVVGSYRVDERADLPQSLPDMQALRLDRFTNTEIEQLSRSMLGDAGHSPAVLELLKQETEGNVYFLVEVVRVLAEEAGSLVEIANADLPRRITVGGIQAVVERRLGRVPEDARSLLRIAAIAGRQIDQQLLTSLAKDIDIEDWLTNCANAAVLELLGEEWQFTHDKLRESLMESLSDADRKRIHIEIAETLQNVYSASVDEYAAIISGHYEHAGEALLAATWNLRAGDHARDTYAPDTALIHYRKALEYWEHMQNVPDKLMRTYREICNILDWAGQFDESGEMSRKLLATSEIVDNTEMQAVAWFGMARAEISQGDPSSALKSCEKSEKLARESSAKLVLADALHIKSWCLFDLGDIEAALAAGRESLQSFEHLDNKTKIGHALNVLAVLDATTGNFDQANQEFVRVLKIAEEQGDRHNATSLVNNLGVLAERRGDFQEAFEHYQDALSRAREIGHRRSELETLNNLGEVRVRLGEFEAAENDLRQVIAMSDATGFAQLSNTYRFLAEAHLGQKEMDSAYDAGLEALQRGRAVGSPEYIGAAWRVLGQVAVTTGIPIIIKAEDSENEEQVYVAASCFSESNKIFLETGIDGERARTLREWARFEYQQGNSSRGQELWNEARQLFIQIGAEAEAHRMGDLPHD